jgi:hypothetical protein
VVGRWEKRGDDVDIVDVAVAVLVLILVVVLLARTSIGVCIGCSV